MHRTWASTDPTDFDFEFFYDKKGHFAIILKRLKQNTFLFIENLITFCEQSKAILSR